MHSARHINLYSVNISFIRMILLFLKIAFMYKSYVQSLLLYNICMYLTFYDIFTTYRVINKQFGIEFEKVLVMRMLFLLGPKSVAFRHDTKREKLILMNTRCTSTMSLNQLIRLKWLNRHISWYVCSRYLISLLIMINEGLYCNTNACNTLIRQPFSPTQSHKRGGHFSLLEGRTHRIE